MATSKSGGRKQSPETQLRHAKREINELRRKVQAVKAELDHRRTIGGMMSNLCFNLAQSEHYDQQHRQSMRDCREAWDKIKRVEDANGN